MTTVYFATNRRPNRAQDPDDFGKDFSDDGLVNLRFGRAEVTGPKFDQYAIEVAPEFLAADPRNQQLGSQQIFSEVRKEMQQNAKDTLVFIHGFNTSFHDALTCTAKLRETLEGHPLNMMVFSWPSDGSMLPFRAYKNDRVDAVASGVAFARGLLKLADFLHHLSAEENCGQNLHLMAHSMGNYVLRHTLVEMRKQLAGTVPRIFETIFLMAADEDDDAFEHDYKLLLLPRLANRVKVYFNETDPALVASDATKANPDRLGSAGPLHPRQLPNKVSLVDCSKVAVRQHGYYSGNDRVAADVLQVLQGIPADEITGRQYITETNRYRLEVIDPAAQGAQ